MAASFVAQMISVVVFCTLIAASAAQSEEQSRVSWVGDQQAPYHVSIWFFNNFMCSGTLIGSRYILTAAQCVVGMTPEYYANMTVKTGSNNLHRGGEFHSVQSVTIHPNYTFSLNGFNSNDIAVIKLTNIVRLTPNQQGIMVGKEDLANGTQAVVTGWARNSVSALLRNARSTVISNEECQEKVNNALQPNQFCTFDAPESTLCVGNAGSPLVTDHKLFGILSWAGQYGSGFPEVYVNLAPYRIFIAQAMSYNY